MDDIKGIGKTTRDKLFQHFKTIARMKAASMEEIAEVIGKSKAALLAEALAIDNESK